MRRREFISLLGGAVAWPVGAHGQQTLPVVGYLGTVASDADRVSGFRDGLRQSGYVEDRDVSVEYRWVESHQEDDAGKSRASRSHSCSAQNAGKERIVMSTITTKDGTEIFRDPRKVVSDPEARYYGGRVEERSLVPLGEARLGRIGFDEWLRRSRAAA
jgi:hypothetical protein